AVFALSGRSRRPRTIPAGLRRGGSEREGIPRAGPRGRFGRWHEAVFAGRRSTIWNAFEDVDVLGDDPPDLARRRFRDHAARLRRRREPYPLTRLRSRNQEGRLFYKASSARDAGHIHLPDSILHSRTQA